MKTRKKQIWFLILSLVCLALVVGGYLYIQTSTYHWGRINAFKDKLKGKNEHGLDDSSFMYHLNALVERGDVIHERILLPKIEAINYSAFWKAENDNFNKCVWATGMSYKVNPNYPKGQYLLDPTGIAYVVVWYVPKDKEWLYSVLSKYR